MNRRAIFIDRDGTLIEDKDYLHTPEEVRFIPGVIAALKKAVDAGFMIVMVTNQSGIGRGYFTMADLERVHQFIAEQMGAEGVRCIKTYVAPEAPDMPSRGRKPSPQFLFDARDEFGIDLAQSYMIGDKLIDVECGWNAGVRKSILVRTGYGERVEREFNNRLARAIVTDTLVSAIDWILRDSLE